MSGPDERPDDARSMRWQLLGGLAVLSSLVVFFCLEVQGQWARVADDNVPTARAMPQTLASPAVAASAPVDEPVPWCAGPSFSADGGGHLFRAALQDALRDAHLAARAVLGAGTTPRSHAMGHYLAWSASEAERRADLARDPSCADRTCGAAQRLAGAMAREELARLAAAGRDPVTYAMAYEACDAMAPGTRDRGSCQLIHAEQWARLDAGNATPWLAVAAQATARKDAPALREALYRVSTAQRSDTHRGRLTAALWPHGPTGVDTPAPMAWAVMLGALESARRPPPFGAIDLPCAEAALADANRRQVCDGVAHLFFERSDTLAARQFGLALGQRLGWPGERVAAARQTHDAWLQVLQTESPAADRLTCGNAVDLARFVRLQAAAGEVGAVRQVLLESGVSEAEWAARRRGGALKKGTAEGGAQDTPVRIAGPLQAVSSQAVTPDGPGASLGSSALGQP